MMKSDWMVLKCFDCEDHYWMQKMGDGTYNCPGCDFYFDKAHADHMAEELKDNHYLHGSNRDWFMDVFRYFKAENLFPEIKMVEHGIGQWLYIDDVGRNEILKAFRQRKYTLQNELILIDDVIKELEE